MPNKNKINFDDYTNNYNQMLRKQTGFFSKDETYFAQYKVQIVRERTLREPRRILEFGCGIGGNIPFLREAFPSSEIMGSDVSAASLEVACAKNPDIFFWREGDTTTTHRDFNLILVAGVFHHIPPSERVDVAKLLFSRLVREGVVFVFEHNPYNPITRHIVSHCPYDEDAVLLEPGELKRLLLQSGFKVEAQKFAIFFPQWFKLALSLEKYLGWLPLGGQYWTMALKR
jgi:SAM-dependent methyltransferase